MKPVNSKSLFAFICDQMQGVASGETSLDQGKVMANLAKQAHNLLKYETERARTLMDLSMHNKEFKTNIELREIESKKFDNNQAD